jgi:hypothetical protein
MVPQRWYRYEIPYMALHLTQHILFWMSGVTRWNVVIMLAPTDSATDIEQVLGMFDAADDIVI